MGWLRDPSRFLVWSLMLLLATQATAGTPIFFGEVSGDGQSATGVDATRLYAALNKEQVAAAQPRVAAISAGVIGMIDGSGRFVHFARPVEEWAALPDDVLLMVLSVEGADELVYTRDRGDDFVSLVLGVSLQLADPRTGQVVYTDFDVVDGLSDFDKQGRPYWDRDYEGKTLSKRGMWTTEKIDRPGFYCTMLEVLVKRMTEQCLAQFDPATVDGEVVRMVNGKALVNQGRTSGFFVNSRLASPDGSIVLAVEQSYPDYCLATIVQGPERIEPWTKVRGYRAAGTGPGSTLVAVSRVIFSNDVLSHPDFVTLKEDEDNFNAALAGNQDAVALYQALMATRLTKALSDTGAFRMSYPVSGLASLNRAKIRMNTTLNLKLREEDPFFYQSLVVPDQGIVAIVSNPLSGTRPIIMGNGQVGNKQMRYVRAICDLHLFDTRSLGVLASGYGVGNDGVIEVIREVDGKVAFASAKPHLRLLKGALFPQPMPAENFPGGAFHVAAHQLADQYTPVDVMAEAQGGDNQEVRARLKKPFIVSPGQPVDICYHMGNLAIEQGSDVKTSIYDHSGNGTFAALEDGTWYIDVSEWKDGQADKSQLKNARLPLYGRNKNRRDPYGLGVVQIEGRGDAKGVISDEDAGYMLLAGLGGHADIPIQLPGPAIQSLREYQAARFARDAAFVNADFFNEPVVGDDAEGVEARVFRLRIAKANAPILDLRKRDGQMTLGRDLKMTLQLKDLADKATFTKVDELELSAEEFSGDDAARYMLWATLEPRFIDFYKTQKMEASQ